MAGCLLVSEPEPHKLSTKIVFAVPVSSTLGFLSLPLHWVFFAFSFHHGSFAELGFCYASPLPLGGRALVVSATLNLRNGTIYVQGVCNFLGSVSPQQKFEAMDGPVLHHSFICQTKENISLRCEGRLTQKTQREERPEAQFWLLFLYAFSPPPESALCELS